MNLHIISASIIKDKNLLTLIKEYTKRLSSIKLKITEFDEKNMTKDQINNKIWSLTPQNSYKIILDEAGKNYSTLELYSFINKISNKEICLLIGGADGFNSQTKEKADSLLSLSSLTFPHQIARLILVEQIYRLQSIANNHPYHRE